MELALVRTLVAHLVRNNNRLDQDLILVDSKHVVPEEAMAPPPLKLEQDSQEPRGIVQEEMDANMLIVQVTGHGSVGGGGHKIELIA